MQVDITYKMSDHFLISNHDTCQQKKFFMLKTLKASHLSYLDQNGVSHSNLKVKENPPSFDVKKPIGKRHLEQPREYYCVSSFFLLKGTRMIEVCLH